MPHVNYLIKRKRSSFSILTHLRRFVPTSLNVGVRATGFFEKYLGLLVVLGRNKAKAFHSLLDRVWGKFSNKKSCRLQGKEILLKLVLHALPSYTTGIFLLSKFIIDKLNGLLKKFWWRSNGASIKINWLNWCNMGLSKAKGGLGFRNMDSYNMALLAK